MPPFLLARSKSISIGERGSCCRQYVGREGFWFEKNVAHLRKQWPAAFKTSTMRERCLDHLGQPATKEAVALEYCLRRRNEIDRDVEKLKAGPRALSPDDVATTGSALANRTAMALRGRIPLQSLDAEKIQRLQEWWRWQTEAPVDLLLQRPDADWGELTELANDQQLQAINAAFDEALSASGLLLKDDSKEATRAVYLQELQRWAGEALLARASGTTKAPKPKGTTRTISIDALCDLSVREGWHAKSSRAGVRNALRKLMEWADENHGLELLASLQPEHLREYSSALWKHQPKSARKDLGYLKSIYDCGIQNDVLPSPSPCSGIVRPKREHRRQRAKTIDKNKSMSAEQLQALDAAMANDPQVDIYWLQRFTGARLQEIAGLRKCDFVLKGGYRCIAIQPHEGRGLGTNGQSDGLKTTNSIRYIPLPSALDGLWKKHQAKSEEPAFERTSKERSWGENYRSRQSNAAIRVGLPSGSHALRDTLHQTLKDAREDSDVIKMITGKKLSISDYLHDNLDNMKKAIEKYAELRPLSQGGKSRKSHGRE